MNKTNAKNARLVVPRNIMAAALSNPEFRARGVRPTKGPGSYVRQPKHRTQAHAYA